MLHAPGSPGDAPCPRRSQATIRVSKDPELGTIDITVNDPAFEADPKRHGGGVTLRREDAMWLANALLLALGKRKDFTYTRTSKAK